MIEELKGRLYSTVVGSFPYRVNREHMKSTNWAGVKEIRETSHRTLDFQLDRGIDFPSDGQFFDMIDMYVQPLIESGLLEKDYTLGEGEAPPKHPITSLEAELEEKARSRGAAGLRVPITGPFTLAFRVKGEKKSLIEESNDKGIRKLANAVSDFCEGFDGALSESILSVDEPVLPFVLAAFGEDFVRETLNGVFRAIRRNHSCMHVCGAVKSISNLALSLDVEILDHEFQGTDNSGLYSKAALEKNNKILSYGFLNTNPKQVLRAGRILVESEEELMGKLVNVCRMYGVENLMVSPDCGFGGWKHMKVAEDEKWRAIGEKLYGMVKARDRYLVTHKSESKRIEKR